MVPPSGPPAFPASCPHPVRMGRLQVGVWGQRQPLSPCPSPQLTCRPMGPGGPLKPLVPSSPLAPKCPWGPRAPGSPSAPWTGTGTQIVRCSLSTNPTWSGHQAQSPTPRPTPRAEGNHSRSETPGDSSGAEGHSLLLQAAPQDQWVREVQEGPGGERRVRDSRRQEVKGQCHGLGRWLSGRALNGSGLDFQSGPVPAHTGQVTALTCSPLFPLVPFCPGSPTSPCVEKADETSGKGDGGGGRDNTGLRKPCPQPQFHWDR